MFSQTCRLEKIFNTPKNYKSFIIVYSNLESLSSPPCSYLLQIQNRVTKHSILREKKMKNTFSQFDFNIGWWYTWSTFLNFNRKYDLQEPVAVRVASTNEASTSMAGLQFAHRGRPSSSHPPFWECSSWRPLLLHILDHKMVRISSFSLSK